MDFVEDHDADAFESEGWDDVEHLLSLEATELERIAKEDLKMKLGHANKFCACLRARANEVLGG